MSRRSKKQLRKTSAGPATGDGLIVATTIENAREVQLAFCAGESVVMKVSKECDRKAVGICVGLAILVFAVFGQALHYDFVNYDDSDYVYQNPEVIKEWTVGGIARAFTRKEIGLWTPLVTVSHMLDCQLYGLNAGRHHLSNLLLHLGSAILLFLILRQMTGALWRSAFVAAVFAIHPLKVESVVWISERKDVLSGLFFLLTLAAYLRYIRRPGSMGRYILVIILFALDLMSKPMVVTLPFVLMLLDYWPLKRLFVERLSRLEEFEGLPFQNSSLERVGHPLATLNWRAVVEKVPLLALSIGLCFVTLHGGNGALTGIEPIPFWVRMAEAPLWVVTYLWQMIWPAGLAVIYTHSEAGLPWWPAAFALCGAISVGMFLLRKNRPYLWMGWLWNIGMLVPVLGIVQISRHARADHYNYLPQIGLYIALTWATVDWVGQWWHRRIILGSMAVAALCVMSVVAWNQTFYWRDGETLWTHALSCTQDNSIANNDLGNCLVQQGRMDEAIIHYREAVRINADYSEAHNNLGNVLALRGQPEEALAQYRDALRINPNLVNAHFNLGNALFQLGQTMEAVAQYREALQINPADPEAHSNLGNSLLRQGRISEATAQFREALRINPAYSQAHYNLGNALFQQGQMEDAVVNYREALQNDPGSMESHYNFGTALLQLGRTEEAIAQYRETLRINPNYAEAHNNLGNALLRQGESERAIAQYREALRINPAFLECHYNIGKALFQNGQTEDALAHAQMALQLAEAQSNTTLAEQLRREIKLYEAARRPEPVR